MISSDNYPLTALSQQLTSLDSEASATLPTSLRRQRIRGSAGSMTKAQSISAIGRKGSFETEVWGEADMKWSYRRHEAKAKCEWQKSLQENHTSTNGGEDNATRSSLWDIYGKPIPWCEDFLLLLTSCEKWLAYYLTQHFSPTFVMYSLLILLDSVIYFSISKVSVVLTSLIMANGVG